MASRTATKSRSGRSSGAIPGGYLQQSQRPIVILAFLVPFIIIHHLGTRLFGVDVGAASILRLMISNLGIYGSSVPAVLVVVTLLVWHIIRGDRWSVSFETLPVMAAESFLFALPVFGIGYICRQTLPMTVGSSHSLMAGWCLSLGAGVYEELLFRLYICGAVYLICAYVFKAKPRNATIIAVILSSVLFSLYHYMGTERPHLFTFVFRALAGVYFAILFSVRGYGITAGAHAFYDVIVVTLSPI